MQTALILEYQKSVDLHTLSRLRLPWRATRSFVIDVTATTGSALPWSLHGWVFIS
jgi:hypothetical protein